MNYTNYNYYNNLTKYIDYIMIQMLLQFGKLSVNSYYQLK